jgi:two-component system sensor histidine kinase ChiS
LEVFEPIVRAHGGFVDKFIGDAIMAIFPGDPSRAIAAANALHAAVATFNRGQSTAKMPLAIGVGIHRGTVVLGTVGGAERLEVTAIGDAVNVAARLEALTKPLGASTIVSEDVMGPDRTGVRRVGAVRVKGRNAPVELFELLDSIADAGERAEKEASEDRFQRGLRAFAQGDLGRAVEHFEAVVTGAPRDRIATIYLERARDLAQRGLPDGFAGDLDGV